MATPSTPSASSASSAAIRVPGLCDLALAGDGLWGTWSTLHATAALDHQWEMLERTGSLAALRIVAGIEEGFRPSTTGIPFSDSDVYKWVDAASRALVGPHPPELEERLAAVVRSIRLAQEPDGYLNTWIQAFSPGGRFRDLVIEHELYCLGHLIEAAISHHEATGTDDLFGVGVRAADLVVREFLHAAPHRVPGHQEVELALVRLHRVTGDDRYLATAKAFIDRRGHGRHNGRDLAAGFATLAVRERRRRRRQKAYERSHPGWTSPVFQGDDHFEPTRELVVRFIRDAASGRYFQTQVPVRDQLEPHGHAVRFGYQQAAMAMLARDAGDETLAAATVAAWERMVEAHLFASGGVGALPIVEAYDEPFALDPDVAYLETCAGIAGILWDRELGLLTGDPAADDLLEWQLLNAVDVAMAADARSFAYDNPLRVPPGVGRKVWFSVPCCPSNLSRTWASLPSLQLSATDHELRVHQLFASRGTFAGVEVQVDSALPWSGEVVVRLAPMDEVVGRPDRLKVRLPSWSNDPVVEVVGGSVVDLPDRPAPRQTASGVDPHGARWLDVELGDGPCEVRLSLDLEVRLLCQDRRVPSVGGSVAVARGPVLYCLEGVDHDGLDHLALSDLELDPSSLQAGDGPAPDLFGGAVDVRGATVDGRPLRFVPYFLWGNRGATGMTAFLRAAG